MLTEVLMEFTSNDDVENDVNTSWFENDIRPLVVAVAATFNTSPCEIYSWVQGLLCPRPYVGALSDDARLTSVCLTSLWRLSVAYIAPKSRTERQDKIGTKVAHVTRDSGTTFKVKRSQVNLQGAGASCNGLHLVFDSCTSFHSIHNVVDRNVLQ